MPMTRKSHCLVALGAIAIIISNTVVASADDFSGMWVVSGSIGNPVVGRVLPVCIFKQDGNQIHAWCKGPNGLGSAEGTANGKEIMFHWDDVATNEMGWDATSTFKGKLGSDGVIRGTWTTTAIPNATGTWNGQKVK
jgi:hypothetical protein